LRRRRAATPLSSKERGGGEVFLLPRSAEVAGPKLIQIPVIKLIFVISRKTASL